MPVYTFCCPMGHHTERFFAMSEYRSGRKVACEECERPARQIITAPALHTLGTFSRDIADHDVQRSRDPGDGSYHDPNLFDRRTGKPTRITSPKHRERVMRELGVHETPPSDQAKDVARERVRKPKHFSASGSRA